jgi:hypothetical protein
MRCSPTGRAFLEVVALGAEEHQGDFARRVVAIDAIGLARVMRPAVAIDGQRQSDHRANRRLGKLRGQAAVDQAGGQMPQQAGDIAAGGALDQCPQFGADAA